MAKETEKPTIKRTRIVKMYPVVSTKEKPLTPEQIAENKVRNVTEYAMKRFNHAVHAIRVLGNCFGTAYSYGKCKSGDTTELQIDRIEKGLIAAVKQTATNLRTGQKIVDAGISL